MYQMEQEQPSLTRELFGSPLKAQGTLQKLSLASTVLSNKMWSNAMMGKGIQWGGVVGFRGIALGQGAQGIGVARALSPAHAVHGVMDFASPQNARAFKRYGLFGTSNVKRIASGDGYYGGVLNRTGNKAANFLGKLLGGGTIDFTKFDVEDAKITRPLSHSDATWEAYKKTNMKGPSSGKFVKRNINREFKIQREETRQAIQAVRSNAKRRTLVRSAARIGKFASWTAATAIAFDIGTAIGGAATNIIGNLADRAETGLGSLINRDMEFGGKVGIGFYSGRSGSERQRALSAIGRGYSGSAGMGNEAGYQHVDSTW